MANWFTILVTTLPLLGAVAFSAPEPAKISGKTMGTSYSVKYVLPAKTKDGIKALSKKIRDRLVDLNRALSTWDRNSEISKSSNWPSLKAFPVGQDFLATAQIAHVISKSTGGSFDPTMAPLVNLWGFGPNKVNGPPTIKQVVTLQKSIGYEKIAIQSQPPALNKAHAAISLDYSAIAKGYAVDEVGKILELSGIYHFMVEIGGEVLAKGEKRPGSPWRIAIEKPIDGIRTIGRVMEIRDRAIATSGDYRNFYKAKGARFSHILDPRTGFPVKHKTASVTVIDRTCAEADGLATALMVMGHQEGLKWAQKHRKTVLFIVREGEGFREYQTADFQEFLAH